MHQHSPNELIVRTSINSETKDLFLRSNMPLWSSPFRSFDFVAILLCHYASALGLDLHICAPVTKNQLDRLEEFLQIWRCWKPELFRNITISADQEIDSLKPRGSKAALSFSGGVDASFSLVAHHAKMLGRLSKDIDLGILIIGMDIQLSDERSAKRAFANAKLCLQSLGARCATISTNWRDDFCHDWSASHVIPIAGILQTLHHSHNAGILSSDASYLQEIDVLPFSNATATNHLLGSESFPIITSGGTHTRMERLRTILTQPGFDRTIRTCYMPNAGGGNCGRCRKCILTQTAIIVLGHDPSLSFPVQMSAEDIDAISLGSLGFLYLQEAVKNLSRDHPLYHNLIGALDREKAAMSLSNSAEVAELTAQNKALTMTIAGAQSEISALRNSRSWRMTAPLRRLRLAVNRWRGQLATAESMEADLSWNDSMQPLPVPAISETVSAQQRPGISANPENWENSQDYELIFWKDQWPYRHLSIQELQSLRQKDAEWFLNQMAFRTGPGSAMGFNGSILEVGCGPIGFFELTNEVDVIAQDSLMNKYAEHLSYSTLGKRGSTSYTGANLSEIGGEFDFVVCSNVLDHTADWIDFLIKCQGKLKPNGELLLITDSRGVPMEGHTQIFSPAQLRSLLKLLGAKQFKVDKIEQVPDGHCDYRNYLRVVF
jgi:2-polyprenyl-3-methyl-5-hydroxy-6-metoxy-1,4-benzoquinol methylase